MRRTLAVVLLSVLATLALPAPTQAGGPTSVLITDPESGKATALYYTSHEYAELERLVQASKPTDAPAQGSLQGTAYNLTWLIHDVMIWRTDFVRIGAEGSPPVVETRLLNGDGVMQSRSTFALATEGRALALLLERALDDSALAGPTGSSSAQAAAPDSADTSAPAPLPQPETRWFSVRGWRWAVVGLLAGLAAGVLVARRRPEPRDERRVLEDGVPERVSGRV